MTDENNPTVETTEENNQLNTVDVVDKFSEIKNRYETELTEKDKKIAELEKQLADKEGEVDTAISNLNDEVNEKLAQAKELDQLRENVQELLQDKAEAIVDKYITEGKLVPAQREKALDLCLTDQDMFISLYENAPSIVDTTPTPKSRRVSGDVDKMVQYFKN